MWWRGRTQESALTALERRGEGISAYLDDELSDIERAEIEALFAEDADARDSLDDLRLLTTALASLGEVRAPRSFAIPAPATGAVAPGMFRRMELGIRASAAAAALFFVVALVNQPAGMTVGTFSLDAASSADDTMSAMTAETAPPGDDATAEPAGLLAAPEAGALPDDDGEEAPAPAPGEGTAPTDGASSGRASASQDAAKAGRASDATLGTPMAGTTRDAGASDGVGGVAPALAALAALLTALSVLVARGRVGGTGRQ
jgi:hypothetical protein